MTILKSKDFTGMYLATQVINGVEYSAHGTSTTDAIQSLLKKLIWLDVIDENHAI